MRSFCREGVVYRVVAVLGTDRDPSKNHWDLCLGVSSRICYVASQAGSSTYEPYPQTAGGYLQGCSWVTQAGEELEYSQQAESASRE